MDRPELDRIQESISKMLEDNPQLELQVNRGHWERLLPAIIALIEGVCPECKGEGTVPIKLHSVFEMNTIDVCPKCNGTGRVIPELDKNDCSKCGNPIVGIGSLQSKIVDGKRVHIKCPDGRVNREDEIVTTLTMEITLLRLAEWIAIEHNETRLQADKYSEEAQGLADLLNIIGYRLGGIAR